MTELKVRFLGSGDAFGSGGRLQTCIMLERGDEAYLIDCGATVLIALQQFNVNANKIKAIILSHLHGDHFAGIPFFVLYAQLHSRREEPLLIAGPPGTEQRVKEAMEVFFPGSSRVTRRFELIFQELAYYETKMIGEVTVTPYQAVHPSGSPSLILRLDYAGKLITYSGDTEWTEDLIPATRDTELFISECSFLNKRIKYHLDFLTLQEKRGSLGAKRIILTHMGPDVISSDNLKKYEKAADGQVWSL